GDVGFDREPAAAEPLDIGECPVEPVATPREHRDRRARLRESARCRPPDSRCTTGDNYNRGHDRASLQALRPAHAMQPSGSWLRPSATRSFSGFIRGAYGASTDI